MTVVHAKFLQALVYWRCKKYMKLLQNVLALSIKIESCWKFAQRYLFLSKEREKSENLNYLTELHQKRFGLGVYKMDDY